MCWAVGFAFGLNRLKMYLAANISNPLLAPWLLFGEVQAGAWLRRGSFHPLTLQEIKTTGVAELGVDLLIGSVFVGGVLASLAAAGTYAAVREHRVSIAISRSSCGRAADRYAGASITAWEFARGKLRGDPIYRATLSADVLHLGPNAARRGMRTGADAGAPGGGAAGRRRRHVAARVAAAAAVRTDGRHRDAPAGRGDRARGPRGRRRDRRRRRADAVDGAGERRAAVRRAAPDASRGAGRAADRRRRRGWNRAASCSSGKRTRQQDGALPPCVLAID